MKDYEWEIKECDGHYVAYVNGKFFCSADTHLEAIQELKAEGYVL